MHTIELQGHSVPALGLGTWELRGAECRRAVLDALELGYRHIDTAQAYANEDVIGEAIFESEVPREELFLVTKIWWENLEADEVLRTVYRSLSRLRTQYVDLLLIHWPSEEQPLEEPLDTMMRLQEEGKATMLGVSNFPPTLFQKALEYAPIVCNQVEFHPWLAQTELLRMVQERNLLLTAYCPLARGRVLEEPIIQEIAAAKDKKPSQVVLRWLLQHERVAAIPKSSNPAHRAENLDIFDFELDDTEMQRIFDLTSREERLIDPDFAPTWEQ